MDFDELPDMMTVEEMAKAFRLGRSQAYELTKRYRLTGGKEGIPVKGRAERLNGTAHGGVDLDGEPLEIVDRELLVGDDKRDRGVGREPPRRTTS